MNIYAAFLRAGCLGKDAFVTLRAKLMPRIQSCCDLIDYGVAEALKIKGKDPKNPQVGPWSRRDRFYDSYPGYFSTHVLKIFKSIIFPVHETHIDFLSEEDRLGASKTWNYYFAILGPYCENLIGIFCLRHVTSSTVQPGGPNAFPHIAQYLELLYEESSGETHWLFEKRPRPKHGPVNQSSNASL